MTKTNKVSVMDNNFVGKIEYYLDVVKTINIHFIY